jgi:DNA-directed RNA polymerase subunit M/transcription elongation factor TFIIS
MSIKDSKHSKKIKPIRTSYIYSIPLDYSTFYKDKQYNNIRRIKLIILSDLLVEKKCIDPKDIKKSTKIIKQIEQSCANQSHQLSVKLDVEPVWDNIQFQNIYHSICYKIFNGIQQSPIFRNGITNKNINLNTIAEMNNENIFPGKFENIRNKIKQRFSVKRTLKYSELYKCRKCLKNQCTLEKRYNRSLDEGINLTIHCLFCGNSWNG